jgi:hypothetical protein
MVAPATLKITRSTIARSRTISQPPSMAASIGCVVMFILSIRVAFGLSGFRPTCYSTTNSRLSLLPQARPPDVPNAFITKCLSLFIAPPSAFCNSFFAPTLYRSQTVGNQLNQPLNTRAAASVITKTFNSQPLGGICPSFLCHVHPSGILHGFEISAVQAEGEKAGATSFSHESFRIPRLPGRLVLLVTLSVRYRQSRPRLASPRRSFFDSRGAFSQLVLARHERFLPGKVES